MPYLHRRRKHIVSRPFHKKNSNRRWSDSRVVRRKESRRDTYKIFKNRDSSRQHESDSVHENNESNPNDPAKNSIVVQMPAPAENANEYNLCRRMVLFWLAMLELRTQWTLEPHAHTTTRLLKGLVAPGPKSPFAILCSKSYTLGSPRCCQSRHT